MGCDPEIEVYSRDTREPKLCWPAEVDDEVLDIREKVQKIREEGVTCNSGADAFFCNSFQCIKEKDEVSKLCGLESHEDVLTKLLNEMCEEYKSDHDQIKRIQNGFLKKEKLIEALATKLGYDGISYSDNGVTMTTKDKYTCHYPPVKYPQRL